MKTNVRGNRFHAIAADAAVDWEHPLNYRRVIWYVAPPGVPTGGVTLLNLAAQNTATGNFAPAAAYPGTLNGMSPALNTGWVGAGNGFNALATDGTSSYVNVGSTLPVGAGDFSVAISFKTSINGSTTAYLFAKAVANDANARWALGFNDPTTGIELLTETTLGATAQTSPITGYNDGRWHRALVTFVRGGLATVYLDGGKSSASTDISADVNNSWTSTWTLLVGAYNDAAGAASPAQLFFPGQLHDFSVWFRALSPQEVVQDFQHASNYYGAANSPLRWFATRPVLATGIAFDAASNSGVQTAQSTYTWSHTCTGSNRFLAVDISLLSAGATVTGITYNGVALAAIPNAQRSTVTSFGRIECWGLANPASGTNTISVTLSGSITSVGTAASYANVDQVSPTEAGNSNQATNAGSATDATVDVTSVADQDWIHAALATDDAAVTANQTSRNNVSGGAANSGANEDFGPQSPGTKTMGWTSLGIVSTWAVAGYAIRPVQVAASVAGIDLSHQTGWQPVLAM